MTESIPPKSDGSESNVTLKGRVAGCEVTVTFTAPASELKARLTSVLEQLTEVGLETMPELKTTPPGLEKEPGEASPKIGGADEDAYGRLAREVDLSVEQLRKVVGIKNDQVQVYRTGSLKPSVAASIICFVNEKALGRPSLQYDEFDSLLKANSVKMSAPVSTFCFNMIRDGSFQKKAYEDGRRIVLTPGGEKKAADALKALARGKPAKE